MAPYRRLYIPDYQLSNIFKGTADCSEIPFPYLDKLEEYAAAHVLQPYQRLTGERLEWTGK